MTTPRAVQTDLINALDVLLEGGCLIYANSVAIRGDVITWQAPAASIFTFSSGPATLADYVGWLSTGNYSGVLPDASLIQMTYELADGEIVRHRLAYVPCPVIVDQQLLLEESLGDVVQMYLDDPHLPALVLRSPLRFDFDMAAAGADHPAAHFSLNGDDCRIPCVAPMHPYRFIDFVFRHFYPGLRASRQPWFDDAERRLIGRGVLADAHRRMPHMAWDLHPGLTAAA